MSNLLKIKQGKKNHKLIDFPGTDEKVALTILSSEQMVTCKLLAEKYCESNNITDEDYKETILRQYLIYNALRDKDDVSKNIASSVGELRELLDDVELAYLMTQYSLFIQEVSPFLNAVTEEQFEALKKTLEKMNLKDLSGESLPALRNFLLSLV